MEVTTKGISIQNGSHIQMKLHLSLKELNLVQLFPCPSYLYYAKYILYRFQLWS